MEHDDKIRAKFGLAVCLRDMGNGTSRLFFDDVKADREEDPAAWRHEHFFTFTPEINNSELEAVNLSDDQLKDIGFNIVVRLLALNGRIK